MAWQPPPRPGQAPPPPATPAPAAKEAAFSEGSELL